MTKKLTLHSKCIMHLGNNTINSECVHWSLKLNSGLHFFTLEKTCKMWFIFLPLCVFNTPLRQAFFPYNGSLCLNWHVPAEMLFADIQGAGNFALIRSRMKLHCSKKVVGFFLSPARMNCDILICQ